MVVVVRSSIRSRRRPPKSLQRQGGRHWASAAPLSSSSPPVSAAVGGGRAETDTSAPFDSVREAVDRFSGSAAWSSHLVGRIFAHHKKQDQRVVGTEENEQCISLEEQTAQLEKELRVKEREMLDVL